MSGETLSSPFLFSHKHSCRLHPLWADGWMTSQQMFKAGCWHGIKGLVPRRCRQDHASTTTSQMWQGILYDRRLYLEVGTWPSVFFLYNRAAVDPCCVHYRHSRCYHPLMLSSQSYLCPALLNLLFLQRRNTDFDGTPPYKRCLIVEWWSHLCQTTGRAIGGRWRGKKTWPREVTEFGKFRWLICSNLL